MNKEDLVPEDFLRLSAEEQADIIKTSAAKLGRRPEHLEKDVWLCWVLQNLFGMPGHLPMAFKGGLHFPRSLRRLGAFPKMWM